MSGLGGRADVVLLKTDSIVETFAGLPEAEREALSHTAAIMTNALRIQKAILFMSRAHLNTLVRIKKGSGKLTEKREQIDGRTAYRLTLPAKARARATTKATGKPKAKARGKGHRVT